MTIFAVRHVTHYEYRRRVRFGEHRLMFRPRDSADQRLIHSGLRVTPEPGDLRWIHDVFGNCVTIVDLAVSARELRFESLIELEHTPQVGSEFRIDEAALAYPFAYPEHEAADLAPTIAMQYPDDTVRRWARRFLRAGGPTETGHLLMTLCFAIHEGFAYSRRTDRGTQPPAVTLERRRGTCRDFALLMIEALRSLGFAARFVSGYVYVPDRDDASVLGGGSTHAWAQVYLPGAGWVEFDPTNGIVGNRDLIRVAVARTPEQAVPLSGTYDGAAGDFAGMTVEVKVTTQARGDLENGSEPGEPA
jgi:transglutaminase-like putative cysteine protease